MCASLEQHIPFDSLAHLDWHFMEVGLGTVNAGWLHIMRSEILLQMEFIIFQACPTKQAAFLLGQPALYNQLLIQLL